MGGLFSSPKPDTSAMAAQQQELARQRELVERQRADQAREKAALDAQEAARNTALTGRLRGRALLLGDDELGVEEAEARGTAPLKNKLGAA